MACPRPASIVSIKASKTMEHISQSAPTNEPPNFLHPRWIIITTGLAVQLFVLGAVLLSMQQPQTPGRYTDRSAPARENGRPHGQCERPGATSGFWQNSLRFDSGPYLQLYRHRHFPARSESPDGPRDLCAILLHRAQPLFVQLAQHQRPLDQPARFYPCDDDTRVIRYLCLSFPLCLKTKQPSQARSSSSLCSSACRPLPCSAQPAHALCLSAHRLRVYRRQFCL